MPKSQALPKNKLSVSPPRKTKAEKTRALILDTAIELFNANGASRVSCNKIADTAGISSGNLYYHFPNKPGVISAIWERIAHEIDQLWSGVEETARSKDAQLKLGQDWVRILWKYRFFFIELVSILREDDKLRADYVEKRNETVDTLTELLRAWVAMRGQADRVDPQLLREIAINYWIVSVKIVDYQVIEKDTAELSEDFISFGVAQVSALVHALELSANSGTNEPPAG